MTRNPALHVIALVRHSFSEGGSLYQTKRSYAKAGLTGMKGIKGIGKTPESSFVIPNEASCYGDLSRHSPSPLVWFDRLTILSLPKEERVGVRGEAFTRVK